MMKRGSPAVWFDWLPQVSRTSLRADLMAGLLGAVLVLPQGVAFATLAGLPPEYGIYTAVVPCVIAGLAGSSWHVMSGPSNANSLAMFAMLSPLALPGGLQYIELALAVTVLVGVLQFAVGVLRLGLLTHFISSSVLLGFTCGSALLIGLYALRDLFGLQLRQSGSALGLLARVAMHPTDIQWPALAVGLVTLGVSLAAKRLSPRSPHMLAGLLAGYGLAWYLNHQVLAEGARVALVGRIPSALPNFDPPPIRWSSLPDLFGIAAALTIVALSQSISIAQAVAARSGQTIDANREFIGQGLSNIVGGFFSCYVSCGSMNRSMLNFEAGARTPLASVFSSILLLVLVWISAPLLGQIPLASIAAVLVLVAWGLLDLARLRRLAKISRLDFGIALGTLAATLLLRLEIAILLGTMVSLIVYLYQTARPALRPLVPDPDDPMRRFTPLDEFDGPRPECPQLQLLRVEGAIYFGAVHYVTEQLRRYRTDSEQIYLLAMTKSMNFIDVAAAEMWEKELAARRAVGGDIFFHRPRRQVLETWDRTGFRREKLPNHIFQTKHQALATIVPQLDPGICAGCQARIFSECARQPGGAAAADTDSAPTGSVPTGSVPTGSVPTGSTPTGSTPTGSASA
ncbi:MAG: SulP family inorganic anion transporter [Burkholderiaceae bacterium]